MILIGSSIHPKVIVGVAATAAVLILGMALLVEHGMGVPPCKLCIWQRWPYVGAALVAIVLYGFRARLTERHWCIAAVAIGLLIGLSGDVAFYHVGIEQGWWPGPTGCTADSMSGLSPSDALAKIMAAPVVRCDEIAMEILGLSLAAWNVVCAWSLGLATAVFGYLRLKSGVADI